MNLAIFSKTGSKKCECQKFLVFFICRKQEEMNAKCSFTRLLRESEGDLAISEFLPLGEQKCESRFFFDKRGAKSVNLSIFSKMGIKKCECQKFITFFFCRKQEEMDAKCSFLLFLRESKRDLAITAFQSSWG